MAAGEASPRVVKLLFSFGGVILPRPGDHALRYVGGNTHIATLPRDSLFEDLLSKATDSFGSVPVIKYQLPDHDLDSLITVSSSEDLRYMFDEFDKISEPDPRLRVFLFNPVPSPARHFFEDRYVEALNSAVPSDPPSIPLHRIPSISSNDGTSAPSPTVDSLIDPDPSPGPVAPISGTSNVIGLVVPHPVYMNYVPNSSHLHSFGAVGYVAVPGGPYMPGMPIMSESVYGGNTMQPLPQLLPMPRFPNMQSGNADRHNAGHRVPNHVPQGQALPHAYSDSLLQEVAIGGVQETNQMYHSVRPMDVGSCSTQQCNGFVTGSVVGEHRGGAVQMVVVGPMSGGHDHPWMPKIQNESENIMVKPTENVHHNIPVFSTGIAGFPGDLNDPYMLKSSNNARPPIFADMWPNQQPSYLHTVQNLAAQDFLNAKVMAVDSTLAKTEMLHTLNPLIQGAGPENPPGNRKAVETMTDTHGLSEEISGIIEQSRIAPRSGTSTPKCVNGDGSTLDVARRDKSEPVEAKEPLGNVFVNSGGLAEPSSINLSEQLPHFPLDMAYANSVPAEALLPPLPGNHEPFPHHPIAVGEPPIPPKRLLGISNSNKLLVADSREHISAAPPVDILSDITSPTSNPPLPLPSSGKPSENNAAGVRNPVPLESLLINPDPWANQIIPAQPSRTTRVASGDSLASKDLGIEDHVSPNGESSHATIMYKGNGPKPSLDLNLDPLLDLISPVKDSLDAPTNQGLQNSCDSLHALATQSSVPSVTVVPVAVSVGPLTSFSDGLSFETKEPDAVPHSAQGVHSVVALQSAIPPDRGVELKQSDKPNHGILIAEGMERLQVIKNSDLEELRELGSGTFGTVYHGKWRGTDVAIKRINDRCFAGKPSDQEQMKTDFWNEACNLADLHHPNVVAFYGVVLDGPGGSVATVTEFMVNGSLRNALQRNDKPLDKRKRLLIAMDAAFGMEYLHGKKIVHFDLKSDNLLVNMRDPHRPICKVGDLGLSKVKCQTLISGGVRGTLPWMAPELLSGDSNLVSEKVDIFSFGIVMWELLTGEEPYADLHYGAIIGGIVNNSLRPPIPESCDPEWRSLMEKCWSAEPYDRPSFTEVASKLRSMAASRKAQSHPNSSAPPQVLK